MWLDTLMMRASTLMDDEFQWVKTRMMESAKDGFIEAYNQGDERLAQIEGKLDKMNQHFQSMSLPNDLDDPWTPKFKEYKHQFAQTRKDGRRWVLEAEMRHASERDMVRQNTLKLETMGAMNAAMLTHMPAVLSSFRTAAQQTYAPLAVPGARVRLNRADSDSD